MSELRVVRAIIDDPSKSGYFARRRQGSPKHKELQSIRKSNPRGDINPTKTDRALIDYELGDGRKTREAILHMLLERGLARADFDTGRS
jgi:hypothetical protein